MNQVIQQYISNAKANGQDEISIRHSLLSSGWTPEEIDAAFLSTGSSSVVPSAGIVRTKADKNAKWALGLAGGVVLFYFIWSPITLLMTFAGVILAIMGLRSSHKGMAITALILHLLYIAFLVLTIYTYLHIVNTKTWPFTNEPLTQQELQEFEIE